MANQMGSYDPTELTPENIRNVCILAHVDHGKTSIADSLLSLNGLVSKRAVGSTRFLDDRPDEQLRGITMKSSAVSLIDVINVNDDKVPVILNLVDTPGHIDFSSEVTAAIRICDGAIIVVDVVEGVCAQTKEVIKQAYSEKLKMLLIVNKIDRLVVDLAQDPKTMFQSILRIIEDCNAYLASLNYLELEGSVVEFFAPELGNVIFASAVDGWGFTLQNVAQMFIAAIEGENVDSLISKLWDFDCFVQSKDRRLRQGASEKNKACLFVQLITSTLHYIYKSVVVDRDIDNISIIIDKLQLKDVPQYRHFSDIRMKLKVILESWQPLSKCILSQCFTIIPSPLQLQDERVCYLLNVDDRSAGIVDTFKKCAKAGPVVAYITKMTAANISALHSTQIFMPKPRDSMVVINNAPINNCEPTVEIIALIRIFSGEVHSGQELYLLNYDSEPTKIVITDVFILLGREYKRVRSIQAGYICGISSANLQNLHFRTATLSSVPDIPPIIEQAGMEPIICNVVSPVDPNDLGHLRAALNMLQQSDTGVKFILNNAGEYLLMTAGDVHLQKCLEDLRLNFGDVKFTISPPIYSLRETVGISENTSNEQDISVVAIPKSLVEFMDKHRVVLKNSKEPQKIFKAFDFSTCDKPWNLLNADNIWSVNDTNLLINCMHTTENDNIIIAAFNASCNAGPLCEEPLHNCAFILKRIDSNIISNAQQTNALIQQIRLYFRDALLKQNPVLMEPIFTTNIQTDVQSLGKLYSEVHKRNGKVLEALDVDDKNKTFVVKAFIPGMESEGFVNDIRKISSGGANPSLNFSHYQIVGADPIKVGAIDDDEEEDTYNRSNRLKNQVRRRKGLPVDDQIVVHAEKQRTLKK